jgi:hypothetical protein
MRTELEAAWQRCSKGLIYYAMRSNLLLLHRSYDRVAQTLAALGFGVDLGLQPIPHFAFSVITRFHAQYVLAQRLFAHRRELREIERLRIGGRRIENHVALVEHRSELRALLLHDRSFALALREAHVDDERV